MKLIITSPVAMNEYNISWIELHTSNGSFIVQYGHAPMILPLAINSEIRFQLKSGKHESIAISQGIADIDRNSVNLIVNNAA